MSFLFRSQVLLLAFLFSLIVSGVGCGVKGPPLPPLATTPQQSELHTVDSSNPKPQASPSGPPSPQPKE